MIWRIALDNAVAARIALAMQVIALAAGLIVTTVLATLVQPLRAGGVPGARCADDAGWLALEERSGQLRERFSVSELERVAEGARTFSLMRVATLGVPVQLGDERIGDKATFVDPEIFKAVCIDLTTGRAPSSSRGDDPEVVVRGGLLRNANGRPLRVGLLDVRPVGMTGDFAGFSLANPDEQVWLPWWHAPAAGFDIRSTDMAVTRALIVARLGASHAQIQNELREILAREQGAFGDAAALTSSRSVVVDASSAQALQRFAVLLASVGAAIVALLIGNLALYQSGRQAPFERLAYTLSAVGATPAHIAIIAFAEPIIVAALSCALALGLAPYARAALSIFADSSNVSSALAATTMPLATVLVASGLVGFCIGAFRWLAYDRKRRSAKISRGGAAQRFAPYLIIVETLLAAGTVALAAMGVLAYRSAVPTAFGYDVGDVRVYQVDGSNGVDHPQMAARARQAIDAIGAAGHDLQVAVSSNLLPIGTDAIETAVVSIDNGKVQTKINRIAGDFFGVLRMRVQAGRPLGSDVGATGALEPSEIVVNRALNAAGTGQFGTPLGLRTLYIDEKKEPPLVIPVGWVDEVSSGTNAPDAQRRLSPMAYLPLTRVHWGIPSVYVWVRHPHGADSATVDRAVRAGIADLLPSAHIAKTWTGEALLDSVLLRERAFAWLFGLAAIGASAIAAMGLLGLVTLIAQQRRIEFAVRLAVGTSRQAITAGFALSIAIPVTIGILIATAAAIVGAPHVKQYLSGADPQPALAMLVASAVVVAAFCAAIARQLWSIFDQDLMVLLRAPGEA